MHLSKHRIRENEQHMAIEGVRYIYDEDGNPKSVLLGLDKWGETWDDLYDGRMAEEVQKEGPMIP